MKIHNQELAALSETDPITVSALKNYSIITDNETSILAYNAEDDSWASIFVSDRTQANFGGIFSSMTDTIKIKSHENPIEFEIWESDEVSSADGLQNIADILNGRILVEPLGTPLIAAQQSVTSDSTNLQLGLGCTRLTMFARGTDMRYLLGTDNTVVADGSTSHFIASGERMDIYLGNFQYIAVISDATTNGTGVLEISELY